VGLAYDLMAKELEAVRALATKCGWNVQEITEQPPCFTVEMWSRPVDGRPPGKERDKYLVRVDCDRYRMQPPAFHFIDPRTGQMNTRQSFPGRQDDSFFNESNGIVVICNEMNRSCYREAGGSLHNPEGERWTLANWEKYVGARSDLASMLHAIYSRITREAYNGPWEPRPIN
jgi:hypothetical protein